MPLACVVHTKRHFPWTRTYLCTFFKNHFFLLHLVCLPFFPFGSAVVRAARWYPFGPVHGGKGLSALARTASANDNPLEFGCLGPPSFAVMGLVANVAAVGFFWLLTPGRGPEGLALVEVFVSVVQRGLPPLGRTQYQCAPNCIYDATLVDARRTGCGPTSREAQPDAFACLQGESAFAMLWLRFGPGLRPDFGQCCLRGPRSLYRCLSFS
jgi:hypothetical protein